MGASALRGNCAVIHSVDVQWIGMSCEDCDAKFSILKRRKTCCDCSYDFCTSCISRVKGLEKKHRCKRCRIFSSMPLDRDAILGLKIRHLRWFLTSNAVPMNGCKEKSELVDLVMNHLRYKEAASQYPQNFERRTVAPEYLACDSPIGSSESSPVRSINSHSHHPGPSRTVVVEAAIDVARAANIFPDEEEGSIVEITNIHVNSPPEQSTSLSQANEMQIISETITVPNDDIEVHHTEEEVDSHREEKSDAQSDQQMQLEEQKKKIAEQIGTSFHEKTNAAAVSVQELESIEHIDSLSVMQLKLILTRNFINYKGCCEKQELQEKVRNLWTQKQKSKDVDSILDENVCRICMEAAIDSVLLECGHLVTCTDCGKRLHECPICRQYIIRVVHIFKA